MRRKKPEKEKKNFRELLCGSMSIPGDMLLDIPRITLSGNRQLENEKYKKEREYLETSIQLNCKDYVIKLSGKKLEITSITDESICVRGVISGISFTH